MADRNGLSDDVGCGLSLAAVLIAWILAGVGESIADKVAKAHAPAAVAAPPK